MFDTRLLALVAPALLAAGCRFGGTGTDPFAETTFPADSGGISGGQSGSGTIDEGAGGALGDTGSGGTSVADASAMQDSAGGDMAGDASPSGSSGAGGSFSLPSGCQSPTPVAICDPIRNTGCFLPVSFCDIDPTQSTPTGRCVFPPSPPPATPACELTIVSESCAPLSSCVNGACRKLCYCDADCPVAECCTEAAPGPPGAFRMCAPC